MRSGGGHPVSKRGRKPKQPTQILTSPNTPINSPAVSSTNTGQPVNLSQHNVHPPPPVDLNSLQHLAQFQVWQTITVFLCLLFHKKLFFEESKQHVKVSVAESHVRVEVRDEQLQPLKKAIHLTRRPTSPQWRSNQKYRAKKKQAEKIATEARPALHIPATPDPATTISGSSFPWSNGQAGAKRTFFSSMTTASFFSKIDHVW